MNIKLWDSNDRDFGLFETHDQAYEAISEYLKETNFKSYYYRQVCLEDKTLMIDYGSHSHFFYMRRLDGERIKVYSVDGTEQEFCFDAKDTDVES